MADRPQSSAGPSGSGGRPHDWISLDDYLSRLYRDIANLENSGMVVDGRLSFIHHDDMRGEPLRIQVTGRIRCTAGVEVQVDTWLDVRRRRDNRLEVRAYTYSYHAWRGESGQELLRYDNAHGELHRHFFDSLGTEVEVAAIRLDELPTLDAVVEEAVSLARST